MVEKSIKIVNESFNFKHIIESTVDLKIYIRILRCKIVRTQKLKY